MQTHSRDKYLLLTLVTVLLFLIVATVMLCSVPPVDRDALTHHLFVPKLYLQHGGIYEIPAILFSYYPMNLDLLYLIPLALGNDIFPKYIHYLFALLTSFLIYRYLKKHLHINYALFGAIFFLSIPIILKLSISVYVDLGLAFFTTASLLLLMRWTEKGFQIRHLLLAGICCGLAVGTKYNGLVALVILTLFVPVLFQKSASTGNQSNTKAVFLMLAFLFSSLLAVSPWLIRNYMWTGNPIYPLHNTFIQTLPFSPNISEGTEEADVLDYKSNETISLSNPFVTRRILFQEKWWQSLLLPIRFFFEGQDDNPQYFDGKLTPFLFILPCFAFLNRNGSARLSRDKHILLWFGVLFFFFTFFQQVMRIRYMVAIIPPLTILSVFGLHAIISFIEKFLHSKSRMVKLACIAVLPIAILSYNFNYLGKQFDIVQPLSFLSGSIDRDSYISRFRPEYPAIQFLNDEHGETKTLAVFLGNRGYYFDDQVLFDLRGGQSLLCELTKKIEHDFQIADILVSRGFTHLLIRYDLFNQWIGQQLDNSEQQRLLRFLQEQATMIYSNNGHGVFQIAPRNN